MSKKDCTPGWYEVVGGGFVCGNYGTTNSRAAGREVRRSSRRTSTEVLPVRVRAQREARHAALQVRAVARADAARTSRTSTRKTCPTERTRADARTGAGRQRHRSRAARRAPRRSSSDGGLPLLDPGMADAGIEVEAAGQAVVAAGRHQGAPARGEARAPREPTPTTSSPSAWSRASTSPSTGRSAGTTAPGTRRPRGWSRPPIASGRRRARSFRASSSTATTLKLPDRLGLRRPQADRDLPHRSREQAARRTRSRSTASRRSRSRGSAQDIGKTQLPRDRATAPGSRALHVRVTEPGPPPARPRPGRALDRRRPLVADARRLRRAHARLRDPHLERQRIQGQGEGSPHADR